MIKRKLKKLVLTIPEPIQSCGVLNYDVDVSSSNSYGGDAYSYGGDGQSYGGDAYSYGGDGHSYGGDLHQQKLLY